MLYSKNEKINKTGWILDPKHFITFWWEEKGYLIMEVQ